MNEELKKEFREMIENSGWKIPLDGFGERSREEFLSSIICFWESKLAKQQEEFVKCIPEEKPLLVKDEEAEATTNELIMAYNECIADIKSKLESEIK